MTTTIFYRKEAYRDVHSGSLVVVETTENARLFYTRVLWHGDPDDDVVFESDSEEEALRRHERLSGSFKRYSMMWKLIPECRQLIHEQG
jgi:hypothetical protein